MAIALTDNMPRRAPRLPVLMLLLGIACAAQRISDPSTFDSRFYPPALDLKGELHLYFQPFPVEARPLSLRLDGIAAIGPDGALVPLLESPVELRGEELVSAQKRLGSTVLPPGLYGGLSIRIAAASIADEAGTVEPALLGEAVIVEHAFRVSRREATALFVSLGPETMTDVSSGLTPVFWLAEATRQLSSMLGFVSGPGRNVVWVFNKHTMQVVDVVATSSGPAGLALDQRSGLVFVAASGDHAVEIIDSRTRQILGHVRLTAGDEPKEIVLSPDGRTLVSANSGSSTASLLDTGARREIVRLPLPSRPTDVVVDRSRPRVYVLLPRSNAVALIDLRRRRLIATTSLEEKPRQGAISEDGGTLYVITESSPNLLVLDAETLALKARIYVGGGAVSIKVDTRTGFVYVGRRSGDIGVADAAALMSIDEFRVEGVPTFLTIDNEQDALFVVLSDAGLIEKRDLVSRKLLGWLEIEPGGYATVLMGER